MVYIFAAMEFYYLGYFIQLQYYILLPFFIIVTWMSLHKPMTQIDTGMTTATWATDASQDIYTLEGNEFKQVSGKLVHVSAGESGVWGVNAGNNIFYWSVARWQKVPGLLKQIDSGPKGIVCGVNQGDSIYCRNGITDSNPSGPELDQDPWIT